MATATAPAKPLAPKSAAKPGTVGEVKKKAPKDKVARVDYPGLIVEENGEKKRVVLETWPADFDAKKHKPLRRSDFKNESVFLRQRADQLEAKAKELRAQADVVEKAGSTADVAKAKRISALTKKVEELKLQLKASGIDVEAMLKAAMGDAT